MSAQVYRPTFLAGALLLTFMVFRSGERTSRAGGEPLRGGLDPRRDRRGVGRLRRGHRRRAVPPRRGARDPRHRDGRARDGAGARGHPPHRRLDPARHRARLRRLRVPGRADPGVVRDRAQGLRTGPDRRPVLHGARGPVRHPARRGGDLHRAVHDLWRGARILGRRPLLRGDLLRRVREEPHRAGPHDDARGLPARHRVGLGRRHHGHARQRDVAAAAPRRLSQGRGRRHPRRRGHRRDPVAADAGRGRVHHRRVPRDLLPGRAGLRADPDRPLLPRDPAGDRGRHPPLLGSRAGPRHARLLQAARRAGATTSRR